MHGDDANRMREQIGRAKRGDREALARILRSSERTVRAALQGAISERFQAVLSIDDVLQESFAEACRDIARFRDEDENSLHCWLISIARCNVADAIKGLGAKKRGGDRQQVPPAHVDDRYISLIEVLTSGGTSPSCGAARSDAKVSLNEAIEQLPTSYREVVRLYDIQDMSAGEVAAALEISEGAVYMRRRRAMVELREILGTASKYF